MVSPERDKKSAGQAPGNTAAIITVAVECRNCLNRVILFSRTIQTFCYCCGLPVTRLDASGLYYDVPEPTP